jgi:hypothetical protein
VADERISVSRDALRAELAEMELRLRVYFDEQLKHKAENTYVLDIAHKLDRIDRGEFTEVHERAIAARIDRRLGEKSATVWTARERLAAATTAVTAVGTLALYLLVAVHGGAL